MLGKPYMPYDLFVVNLWFADHFVSFPPEAETSVPIRQFIQMVGRIFPKEARRYETLPTSQAAIP